ncbi:hypothetical protein QFZ62_002843 [Clavibacter sp. B3I6]|uniref:DUF262 domain-containing protein n=1 Tax=Clavibacter sp. B3I6 TaxID=3042268 RepID=UPI00277F0AD7|nr:DUF262 domain-containing HNH endonuclease family protein [Clavibacter sp. B3I6]MDQ0745535.1 hypothetical protein [Clavibacter sp. B3I6]
MSDQATAVDLIPIESQTRTIQTCFLQCLYEVPNFQRPYSWTVDQLSDYWDDLVLAQGDFFFGSTVTWVSTKRDLFNDTYSIIDGQQRLTTSAIALSVLRDAFSNIAGDESLIDEGIKSAASNQAAATQRYLIISDDDGNQYPVLKRPESMFREHIQEPGAIPSGAAWNSSAERIGEARRFFEARVLGDLIDLAAPERIERLKMIRANILKARIIQVELASEEDGFLIFETLNTRGADLRLSDLVKNLLIRGGATHSEDRRAIGERWDRVVDMVQARRTTANAADRFIWQSWNSRRTAVKEPELFKAIGKRVKASPAAHLNYLQELEADAATYAYLEDESVGVQPKSRGKRNAFSLPEFVDSVRALAIFDVSVANSTVLAVARKYKETKIVKEADLIEVLKLTENFHFQFTALTNSGSTGGTRARYNRFAVKLEEATTREEVNSAIADLRAKLQASLPNAKEATSAFVDLFYAPKLRLAQAQKPRARKVFIAYILMAFAKKNKNIPAGQNLLTWSVEHIKPQADASESYKDAVFSIGNLTLLTAELNSALGDAPLSEKREALQAGSAYFDPQLRYWVQQQIDDLSDDHIYARSEALAMEAIESVWTL